jgi:hypothetical protein
LSSSLDVIGILKSRKMKWVRHVLCMGEIRNVKKRLVRKLQVRTLHGRPGNRWGWGVY